MSDYKDYAVTVKYEGEIYISALDKEEALEMAKATMLEETNFTMEKWLTYEVEEQESTLLNLDGNYATMEGSN